MLIKAGPSLVTAVSKARHWGLRSWWCLLHAGELTVGQGYLRRCPQRAQLPPWSAAWDETRGGLLFSEKGLLPAWVTLGLVPGPQGDPTERKLEKVDSLGGI